MFFLLYIYIYIFLFCFFLNVFHISYRRFLGLGVFDDISAYDTWICEEENGECVCEHDDFERGKEGQEDE